MTRRYRTQELFARMFLWLAEKSLSGSTERRYTPPF